MIFWPDFTIVSSTFLSAAEEFLYHVVMEIVSVLSGPQKAVRTGVLRLAYLSLRRKGEASEGLHCNASLVNGPHQVPDVPDDMGERDAVDFYGLWPMSQKVQDTVRDSGSPSSSSLLTKVCGMIILRQN